jgi:hypothetical protein
MPRTTSATRTALCWFVVAFSLCHSAAAQYFGVPLIPDPKAERDAELASLGRALERRSQQFAAAARDSFLVVTYAESASQVVESGRHLGGVARLEFVLARRDEDASSPDGRRLRALYYVEHFPLGPEQTRIVDGKLSSLPSRVSTSAGETFKLTDRFGFEALLVDGRRAHHWASSKDPARDSRNLPVDLGLGLPGAPYQSSSQGVSAGSAYDALFDWRGRMYSPPIILEQYGRIVEFCKQGQPGKGYDLRVENTESGAPREAWLSGRFDYRASHRAPYTSSEAQWRIDVENGVPIEYDGLNMLADSRASYVSHRWSLADYKRGDGSRVPYPSACEFLLCKPSPGKSRASSSDEAPQQDPPVTLAWSEKTVTLLVEVDEKAHEDHPALRPETLALWLGVALRWEIEEDCVVVSTPLEAAGNGGVPAFRPFEDLRRGVSEAELEWDWPYASSDASVVDR